MSASPPAPQYPDDEISLVELGQILVRRKLWVVMSFVVCVAIGLAYAFLATPRYEVEVYLDKPFASQLTELNLGRTPATGLPPFSPDQIFGYFTNRLVSDQVRQQFFREVYLPTLGGRDGDIPQQALYETMVRAIRIDKPNPKGRDLYRLKTEADTGEKAVKLATAFLDLAARDAADKLIEDARNDIDLIVRNARRDLEQRRLTAVQRRKDRLVELNEALIVAREVGIAEPQVTNGRFATQDSLSPYMDGTQLFARGTKSLSAEIEVLKARESDDPFITDLRETEARLRQLEAIKLDPESVRVFVADGEIMVPAKPAAPRKALALVLAAVLGLMGGVMIAFMADSVARTRRDYGTGAG
jgi:chain length determinant protein (polysaccharide antigen chain regulator)